jgi:hypothetical protein
MASLLQGSEGNVDDWFVLLLESWSFNEILIGSGFDAFDSNFDSATETSWGGLSVE